jgi:hypothetical protein
MKRTLLISTVLLAGPSFGQEALKPVSQPSTATTDQRVEELRRQQAIQGTENAALKARILELQSLDAQILELERKLEALTVQRAGQSAQPTPKPSVPTNSPALQGSRGPSVTQTTAEHIGKVVEHTQNLPADQLRSPVALACVVFLLVLFALVGTFALIGSFRKFSTIT